MCSRIIPLQLYDTVGLVNASESPTFQLRTYYEAVVESILRWVSDTIGGNDRLNHR